MSDKTKAMIAETVVTIGAVLSARNIFLTRETMVKAGWGKSKVYLRQGGNRGIECWHREV